MICGRCCGFVARYARALRPNGALYQSLAAMNAAWLEFANRRLKEKLALPEHIARCTTVPRLLWVYNSYCHTAVEDYQAGRRGDSAHWPEPHYAGPAFNRSNAEPHAVQEG